MHHARKTRGEKVMQNQLNQNIFEEKKIERLLFSSKWSFLMKRTMRLTPYI